MDAKRRCSSIESTTFEETGLIEIHMFNTAARSFSSMLLAQRGVGRLLFFLSKSV